MGGAWPGLFCSLAFLAVVGSASAAGEVPKKPATDQKAARYASPKATFRTFIEAVRENDLEAARKCWVIDDDNKSGALDVVVGLWISLRQVNQVVVKKFGKKEASALLAGWDRDDVSDAALDLTEKRLAGAEVKISGDTATLKIKWKEDDGSPNEAFLFGDSPFPFRKVAGDWKFDANAMAGLKRGADFFKGTWGPMFRDQMVIMDGVVDGIRKGRLKTVKEVKEFLDRKFAVMEKKYAMEKEHKEERKKANRAPQSTEPPPQATDLKTRRLADNTTALPSVAVSASGIVYVFWWADSGKDPKWVAPAPLPLLPDRFLHQARKEHQQCVPGISVLRDGKWSRASWLGKPDKVCRPVGAWCEGEKLHLLVTDWDTPKTEHLLFDTAKKCWDHVATLPLRLATGDARRQVGKEMHFAVARGKWVHYLRFDGKSWTKLLKLKGSKGANTVRLAVDPRGHAHLLWWCSTGNFEPGVHTYGVLRRGRIHTERVTFDKDPIDCYEFDLGLNPEGEVLLAYKPREKQAALPGKGKQKEPPQGPPRLVADGGIRAGSPRGKQQERPEGSPKLFFRRRTVKGWTEPEPISVPGDLLLGDIFIESCNRQTLVSWVARAEQVSGRLVLWTGVRFCSINTGKGWSAARPCAREGDESDRFPLMRGGEVGRCIDSKGRVHLVWGFCHHCVIAHLKSAASP